jgi:hypothetical protein
MIVYQAHPVSGDYVGEVVCDESPLEPGVYLVPAHCSPIKPPEFNPETHVCKFVGKIEEGSWQLFPIQEAIDTSESLRFQPTKEELDEIARKEKEALDRKKAVLAKLGLSEEDMDNLLL